MHGAFYHFATISLHVLAPGSNLPVAFKTALSNELRIQDLKIMPDPEKAIFDIINRSSKSFDSLDKPTTSVLVYDLQWIR